MAIKTYSKLQPVKYRYSKLGVFSAMLAGNISSAAFAGMEPLDSNFQDQLVAIKNLSSSLAVLDDGAFAGCQQLSSANLGTALETISSNCFSNCASLTQLELPSSLNEIGDNAFSSMRNLQFLTFNCFDSDALQLSATTA